MSSRDRLDEVFSDTDDEHPLTPDMADYEETQKRVTACIEAYRKSDDEGFPEEITEERLYEALCYANMAVEGYADAVVELRREAGYGEDHDS